MTIRFQCPDCDRALSVKDEAAGKKARCPKCSRLVEVPRPAGEPPAEPAPPPEPAAPPDASLEGDSFRPGAAWAGLLKAGPEGHVLASLAWALLGLNLALLVPWLGLLPAWVMAPVHGLAIGLTVALIAWNLVASIQAVRRTGHALDALPLTLAQVLLFGLLFFQLAVHGGASHYQSDTPPGNSRPWRKPFRGSPGSRSWRRSRRSVLSGLTR